MGLLRVQREANPLWYEICRHSWAKVEETLVRMQAKWDMKIKEYLDRNQAPPIHQQGVCSAFRDAGKEQEVYVMACLMVHFQSELNAGLTGPQFEKLMQNWRCGWLDSKLLPEIVAMRADFKIGDINSHTVPQSHSALSDDLMVLQDEEIEEGVMTLIGLARGMKKEQDMMRAHRTAVQRYSVQTIAAECEGQKSKQAAVEASWTEHQVGSSVCFYCDSTLSLSPGNKCLKKPGRSIFKWVWARLAVLQKLSSKLLTVLWLVETNQALKNSHSPTVYMCFLGCNLATGPSPWSPQCSYAGECGQCSHQADDRQDFNGTVPQSQHTDVHHCPPEPACAWSWKGLQA